MKTAGALNICISLIYCMYFPVKTKNQGPFLERCRPNGLVCDRSLHYIGSAAKLLNLRNLDEINT